MAPGPVPLGRGAVPLGWRPVPLGWVSVPLGRACLTPTRRCRGPFWEGNRPGEPCLRLSTGPSRPAPRASARVPSRRGKGGGQVGARTGAAADGGAGPASEVVPAQLEGAGDAVGALDRHPGGDPA